jgi:dTDP-4-dehydrorhamnose 3,5-epimerase
MNFSRTDIYDVVIIEPQIIGDDRGYFSETFRADKLEKFIGYKLNFIQDNESLSSKGVFRGLHYQLSPKAQSKLVRVISGKILDVAVDIRMGSPTFGKYVAVELSSENKKQLFVPKGFAHGFIVLSEKALVLYKVDNFYSKEHDRGVLFSDFEIDWQLSTNEMILSAKDKIQPKLSETKDLFIFREI